MVLPTRAIGSVAVIGFSHWGAQTPFKSILAATITYGAIDYSSR